MARGGVRFHAPGPLAAIFGRARTHRGS